MHTDGGITTIDHHKPTHHRPPSEGFFLLELIMCDPVDAGYIKNGFDVASELSAGSDWEDAGLRIAFDDLIETNRDVAKAVARYAYELLTIEHML